jgi:hypothetical protein
MIQQVLMTAASQEARVVAMYDPNWVETYLIMEIPTERGWMQDSSSCGTMESLLADADWEQLTAAEKAWLRARTLWFDGDSFLVATDEELQQIRDVQAVALSFVDAIYAR